MLLLAMGMKAQNWDTVVKSGNYYYGVGTGKDRQEAEKIAMDFLVSTIISHVSSNFEHRFFQKTASGDVDFTEVMTSCVNTYSQASIGNITVFPVTGSKQNEVRVWVEKTEVQKMFDLRVDRARDMMLLAEEELENSKVDMALQYYYWAYSLIRTVQYPTQVKDKKGRIMIDRLKAKIQEILSDINVKFDKREGDNVDMLFFYKDKPVSSLAFTYNDGRTDCEDNRAKDGRGSLLMSKGYNSDVYHVSIEYEFKGQAMGDAEMEGVINTIVKQPFPDAHFVVSAKEVKGAGNGKVAQNTKVATKNKAYEAEQTAEGKKVLSVATDKERSATGVKLTPKTSQTIENPEEYAHILGEIEKAIRGRNYISAEKYLTSEGRERFRALIKYGQGRVIGTPTMTFFKSAKGNVVARGLQMSFSFTTKGGKKKTFVEDVVLTFNEDRRIDNVTFGLGQVAENDILCKENSWNDETREMLMEFLENYKTAYCLKDSDYIKNVFADDAVIIVGKVAKKNTAPTAHKEHSMTITGQQVITYNRQDKQTYLRNLCRTFRNNEFINIRFTNNDIQWLDKYTNEELYGIQIGQEYNSSTYADKGFLFLLVNMTDHENPQIKVRTWQPNEVDINKIYNAGYFYNE